MDFLEPKVVYVIDHNLSARYNQLVNFLLLPVNKALQDESLAPR